MGCGSGAEVDEEAGAEEALVPSVWGRGPGEGVVRLFAGSEEAAGKASDVLVMKERVEQSFP